MHDHVMSKYADRISEDLRKMYTDVTHSVGHGIATSYMVTLNDHSEYHASGDGDATIG